MHLRWEEHGAVEDVFVLKYNLLLLLYVYS